MVKPTDNTKAYPLTHGKNVFLVGINWALLPSRYNKNVKGFARNQKADYAVTYRYQDINGKTKHVVGLVNLSSIDLDKTVKKVYSLGMLVAGQLERSGYVISFLTGKQFLFIGAIDGVLINEAVGDKELIKEALDTFIQCNTSPESGWLSYAPEEFGITGSLPPENMLNSLSASSEACFRSSSVKKPIFGALSFTLMLLLCLIGWKLYSEHQKQIRQKLAKEALLKKEHKKHEEKKALPSWEDLPNIMTFVERCSEIWKSAPISLAGWVFKEAECLSNFGEGSIRFAYSRASNSVIDDFSYRVRQFYDGKYTPYFNLPGIGDIGGFTQKITFPVVKNNNPLPDADTQIQRITSFAQQTRLAFSLREDDRRVVDSSGNEKMLPWRIFSMKMETSIQPLFLLNELDDTGIRIQGIRASLSQGRLTYTLEGKIYAR